MEPERWQPVISLNASDGEHIAQSGHPPALPRALGALVDDGPCGTLGYAAVEARAAAHHRGETHEALVVSQVGELLGHGPPWAVEESGEVALSIGIDARVAGTQGGPPVGQGPCAGHLVVPPGAERIGEVLEEVSQVDAFEALGDLVRESKRLQRVPHQALHLRRAVLDRPSGQTGLVALGSLDASRHASGEILGTAVDGDGQAAHVGGFPVLIEEREAAHADHAEIHHRPRWVAELLAPTASCTSDGSFPTNLPRRGR